MRVWTRMAGPLFLILLAAACSSSQSPPVVHFAAADSTVIFGRTLQALESDWLEFIAQPKYKSDVDWEELMQKGCG